MLSVQLLRINTLSDVLLNLRFKFWIVHQLTNYFFYSCVDFILTPLLTVSTLVTIHKSSVLAGIVKIIFVVSAVRMLFTIYIAIHTTSTDRTFYNSRQNMLVIQAVGFDVGNTSFLSFFMHLIPQFFCNNCLVNAII